MGRINLERNDEAEARRLKVERWIKKKLPDEIKLALQSISKAAYCSETQTKIPLKAASKGTREALLVELVIKRLKEMGFGVYFKEKEYWVTWGKDKDKEVK